MVKKILNILSTVFLVILIALVVFLFVVRLSGKTPSIFGYHVLRVSSGSMEPTLMQGEVILVKSASSGDIRNGDIITYRSAEGYMEGQLITHRVVTEPELRGDTYYYQTMGDREGAVPDPMITYDQVLGRYVCKLPVIEKIYSFFFTRVGLIAFIVLILALFGYEIISLILSYRTLDSKSDFALLSDTDISESDQEKNSDKKEQNMF